MIRDTGESLFAIKPLSTAAVHPNGSVVQVLLHIGWGPFSELFFSRLDTCFSGAQTSHCSIQLFCVGAEDCTETLYWLRQFSVPNCRSSYLVNWPSYSALYWLLLEISSPYKRMGMVAHAQYPSTWEAEPGGSPWV